MINNICENNKSAQANTISKATIATATQVDNRHNVNNKGHNFEHANDNNNISTSGVVQTTYGHGIWYSEIVDRANNTNNNALVHRQQHYNSIIANNNNNTEREVNKHVWLSTANCDVPKEQKQQPLYTHTNNNCDIIIVDIESGDDHDDDDDDDGLERQLQPLHHQPPAPFSLPPKFFMNANKKFPQIHPTVCDNERSMRKNNMPCARYTASDDCVNTFDIVDSNSGDEVQEEDENDSLASMETLSDNVSIWIDGDKHWVAGVDANTTCSELIWALLNYQNGQSSSQTASLQQQQNQNASDVTTTIPSTTNDEHVIATVINQTNSNQYEKQEKHLPKVYDNDFLEFNLRTSTSEGNRNICTGNKPNIQNTAKTNNTPSTTSNSISNTFTNSSNSSITISTSINPSMPINTKENYKIIQNSTLTAATKTPIASASLSATPIISSLAPVSDMTPTPPPVPPPPPPLTLLPLTLPPGIATVSQLATEYVIVKQYHHCEEYLDGSTKVFDVLPPRNGSNKKECELVLRHLGRAPAVCINNTTPQLSSLISTDKDSGMGSPVGSARSAKFRRRKHKSSQWLAQANTLHPKLSRCSANERLMKIILAQDETIQQQLSLLREKERQITKIEEEKHRKRERELGKNYLLETYLNGLDEAECEPEIQDSVEIFIDEPHQLAKATAISAANPWMTITPSAATLAAGAVTDNIPSAIEALNSMAKHKLKEKEVKKEKKKKRHKEKQTKDEEIQAKNFNLKTNKNKDNEKVDKQQQHHYDNDNEQEIEMQILWLEKIYTLNKQLQKEEELAAKLYGKVRKHQLRKAQQTQREAEMEIDKLDNNLALQCGDIRKVEANLMETNEQLQKKLLLLQRLSIEYLEEQSESNNNNKEHDVTTNTEKHAVKTYITKDPANPLKNDANMLLTNMEKALDIQKLSLNNIKSKEEAIKLEKIIAKPNKDLRPANAEVKETKQNLNFMTQNVTNNPAGENLKSSATNQRSVNCIPSVSTNHCSMFTVTDNREQQQQLHHHSQPEAPTALPTLAVIDVTEQTSHTDDPRPNDTLSTSQMFIDKNMLSSLHVQNAKTIKKQMFHTQTTTSAAAYDSTTLTQPTPTSSAFPKQRFQKTIQQYMPMATTFLTSRPQNSYQQQPKIIAMLQQPSTSSSSCSSHLTTATSSSLPPTVAKASIQQPPTSTSPSPSIMAMNTVDISQLGTLV